MVVQQQLKWLSSLLLCYLASKGVDGGDLRVEYDDTRGEGADIQLGLPTTALRRELGRQKLHDVKIERCNNSYDSLEGLHVCEPTYRRNVAETCRTKEADVWDSSKYEGRLGSSTENTLGWGVAKMLGRSMIKGGYVRPIMKQENVTSDSFNPFADQSVKDGILEIMGWTWLAITILCVAILCIFVSCVFLCPAQCCKCGRKCWRCCRPYPKEKKTSSRFTRWFWPGLFLLGVLFFVILAIIYVTFTNQDVHGVPCTLDKAIYQGAFGTLELAPNNNPAFLGIAPADVFVQNLQKELRYAIEFFNGWTGKSEYAFALKAMYGPLNWTEFNLNGRQYSAWVDQNTGETRNVSLAHTLVGYWALMDPSFGVMDYDRVYENITMLENIPQLMAYLDIPPSDKAKIVNQLTSIANGVDQFAESIHFSTMYSVVSSASDSVLKFEKMIFDPDEDSGDVNLSPYLEAVTIVGYLSAAWGLLSILLSIPVWEEARRTAKKQKRAKEARDGKYAFEEEKRKQAEAVRRASILASEGKEEAAEEALKKMQDSLKQDETAAQLYDENEAKGLPAKSTNKCFPGFLCWWMLLSGIGYLIVGGIFLFIAIFGGDTCSFVMEDLFVQNQYSKYPAVSSTVPRNVSDHCLWEHADGDLVSAFDLTEGLDQVNAVVNSIVSLFLSINVTAIIPDALNIPINVPEKAKQILTDENNLLPTVFLDLANPSLAHLWIASKGVVMSGLSDKGYSIPKDSVSYNVTRALFETAKFPEENWGSLQLADYPWRSGEYEVEVTGLNELSKELQSLMREMNGCATIPNVCAIVDSSCKYTKKTIMIGHDFVSFMDPSDWETETKLKSNWPNSIKSSFINPSVSSLYDCMSEGSVEQKLHFLNTVYISVMKELAMSSILTLTDEHFQDDILNYDVCPVGLSCNVFVSFKRQDDQDINNSSIMVRPYEAFRSSLNQDLNAVLSIDRFRPYLTEMLFAVATTNVATRLQASVNGMVENLNCRAAFTVIESAIKRLCNDLGGDLATLIFSWAMLGLLHILGFIIAFTHWWRIQIIRDAPIIKRSDSGFLRAALMADTAELNEYAETYDPNTLFDDRYNSPLHYASYKGSPECCRILLDHGWDPNARNIFGYTPLNMASAEGHQPVAELLLVYGAHPGITDEWGDAPLHAAARTGKANVIETLLRGGAQVGARDNVNQTAEQVARQFQHDDIAEMLAAAAAATGDQQRRRVSAIEIDNTGGLRRRQGMLEETRPQQSSSSSSMVKQPSSPTHTVGERRPSTATIGERQPTMAVGERRPSTTIGERRPSSMADDTEVASIVGERRPSGTMVVEGPTPEEGGGAGIWRRGSGSRSASMGNDGGNNTIDEPSVI